MPELTNRQIRILRTIIEEYMETAQPVGSEALEKKYELGVSPATIRNEMADLTKAGFLKQPHTSAGRVPTKQAFHFYIDHLMEERKLSVTEEVTAREKIWDARFDFNRLMHQATKVLAQKTQALALAATDQGEVYHAGYANILKVPEFYDIDITRTVLSILDETTDVWNLFSRSLGDQPIHFLLGDELGDEILEPCGMVFTTFQVGRKKRGAIGVLGPARLNYSTVAPTVRYFGDLIEELTKGF